MYVLSFIDTNIVSVYFDADKQSNELETILSKNQIMGNIGDDFRPWYKLTQMLYTIKMTPEEAYDGLIVVQEATPTKIID